jgi:hypothetical protein
MRLHNMQRQLYRDRHTYRNDWNDSRYDNERYDGYSPYAPYGYQGYQNYQAPQPPRVIYAYPPVQQPSIVFELGF